MPSAFSPFIISFYISLSSINYINIDTENSHTACTAAMVQLSKERDKISSAANLATRGSRQEKQGPQCSIRRAKALATRICCKLQCVSVPRDR